ncbi:VanZ family protein [Scytonema sp. UIC 10036]|uniref:VanZ family protein n=1 Tax=Scytonema sp. UIC 10036 TaxID=2304196 RepID=UPI0012DA81B0|nr:VanZ family protein [Scytonema sp. UIC 10036]MUG96250.1 VanZ family protein [Scytonema sp. UIC 10036]
MLSNRFWIFAFWFYLGILLSICISAYIKIIPNEIAQFPYYDTIMHFLLIGMAAYLGDLALEKRKVKIWIFLVPMAPLLVSLFTVSEEFLQKLTPHRSFDLVDLAADFGGIVLFSWLAEMTQVKKSSKG